MIIRVFRARTKPGHTGAELARMAKEVTIPSSLEGERGLLARYAGTGLGETGEEFTVITVWEDLNALKTTMAGDDWESPSWSGSRSAARAPVTSFHGCIAPTPSGGPPVGGVADGGHRGTPAVHECIQRHSVHIGERS
jgi:hypothetical protein